MRRPDSTRERGSMRLVDTHANPNSRQRMRAYSRGLRARAVPRILRHQHRRRVALAMTSHIEAIAERQFPILQPKFGAPKEYVPWSLVAPHETQARRNHAQSLSRLAERGGLSWRELHAVINGRSDCSLDREDAKAQVLAALRDHLTTGKNQ